MSCAPKTTNVTSAGKIQGLLLDSGCRLPCWAGIQVEITEYHTATKILEDRYGIEHVKAGINSLEWEIEGEQLDGLISGTILFSADKVSEILLFFAESANFSVGELVEMFGEPDWVNIIWSGPNSSCLGARLQFPRAGLLVYLDSKENLIGVSENQLISILLIRSIPDTGKWNISDSSVFPWMGYLDYCPN